MKFGEAKLQRIFSEGKNAKETNHEQNDYNKQKNKYPPPPQFFLAKFILTTALILSLTLAFTSCKSAIEDALGNKDVNVTFVIENKYSEPVKNLKIKDCCDNDKETEKDISIATGATQTITIPVKLTIGGLGLIDNVRATFENDDIAFLNGALNPTNSKLQFKLIIGSDKRITEER